MDVVQACIRFHPAPGGAETHVLEVAKGLGRRGHRVEVYTSDLYKETPFTRLDAPYRSVDGLPVRRFRAYSLGGEMHYVLMPGMVPALLARAGSADVLHAHSYGYFQVNAAALARRLKGTPFVLTPHFHPSWSMWGGPRRKLLRRVYDALAARPVLDAADAVIGVSRHEMDQMAQLGFDTSKVRIIPNGIDHRRFDPIPDPSPFRRFAGIAEDDEVVLYTGRLATNKGLDTLLRAAKRVVQRRPRARFVLVGDDQGMGASLRALAFDLGLGDRVVLTGHVADDALFRSAYPAAEVFVLPSEYEAFGIVLLESMACEVPCVVTRAGGMPEVVSEGETGLIVEYGDPEGLARALLDLLGDPSSRREMGRKGRQRVMARYTWERIVERIEGVYREVLSGPL